MSLKGTWSRLLPLSCLAAEGLTRTVLRIIPLRIPVVTGYFCVCDMFHFSVQRSTPRARPSWGAACSVWNAGHKEILTAVPLEGSHAVELGNAHAPQ